LGAKSSFRVGWKGALPVEGCFLADCADTADPVLIDEFIVVPRWLLLGLF
jgi:hypothetical protein